MRETDLTRLVTFTTLYPSREQPSHGVFVEHRLRQLISTQQVVSKVIAPVPWFPFRGGPFGRYATYARVPSAERRHGIEVRHPRYPLIPKIGMTVAPWLLAQAAKREFRKLGASGYRFRAIDAHYFYPDGVAAVLIGRDLQKPVVVTARGTDVNLIPKYELPRRQILWAAQQCSAIITVCQALKDALIGLGVSGERVTVLRNGVDLEMFRPVDRVEARKAVRFDGTTLLSVGSLIERKGHQVAIEALEHLPGVQLAIVGEGELESRLRRLAERLGVSNRVRFVGLVPQQELRFYYSAADALVLPSSREGMANVLLECLACGTPVVATASWGTPEVIADPVAGVLMDRQDPRSLAAAFSKLLQRGTRREDVRRYAERFDWGATTRGQLEIFGRL